MNDRIRERGLRRGIILRVLLITLCLGLAGGTAMAQEEKATKVILFKDGTSVTGKIVEMNINTVKVQTADGAIIVKRFDDIEAINDPQDLVKKTALILPVHSFDIGAEIFYKEYKEPDVMKEDGMMYGAVLSYTYHKNIMFKADLRFAYGKVDYESDISGTMDGIEDQQWELRALLGYDFLVAPAFYVTPYLGVGYRFLRDDSSGMYTSLLASGYKRESTYWYSPVGIEVKKMFGGGWTLGAIAEFDIFWTGSQESDFTDLGGPVFENDQDNGYGARGSIKLQKKADTVTFGVEPFIRYWDVKESGWVYFPVPGGRGYIYEPKNHTTEFGCTLSLMF